MANDGPQVGAVARIVHWIWSPQTLAPVVYFRLALGLFLAGQAFELLASADAEQIYGCAIHFPYYGFGWLPQLSTAAMDVLFGLLAVAGLGVALGFHYRACAIFYFIGFGYAFLRESLQYQNHYYLILLLSGLMAWIPAHGALSIDARRHPALRSATLPAGCLWILRFQVGVVYFYGGLAKLGADWLAGEPMRTWMSRPRAREALPLIGQSFGEEWMVYCFAYSGLVLDLLIVPALLWRPTRLPAFLTITLFHLMNSQLWDIGVFPWMMICVTPIFLPPEWFARFQSGVRHARGAPAAPTVPPLDTRRRLATAALVAYVIVQLLFPFRHVLYPGDANWTEEGSRFAWRMKLRSKDPTQIEFTIVDGATGARRVVPLAELESLLAAGNAPLGAVERKYLQRHLSYIAIKPDALVRFCHWLAEHAHKQGVREPRVYANILATMNSRAATPLVDPAVDLAAQPFSLAPAPWILPNPQPLGSLLKAEADPGGPRSTP